MLHFDLSGKRALVTGANSGIGEAVALKLAKAGADVGINFVHAPDAARDVVGRLHDIGVRALALEADVSDPRQVAHMFGQLDRSWGGIDILVNNAGIDGGPAPAWKAEPVAWRRVVEVDLFGTFHCSREALARMVPAGSGVIINLSSVHEVIPWSGYSAYASSKAAVSMLTRTLAQEAAPHGVRVVAVAPGAVRTPINQNVWSDPAGLADLTAKIPMARLGTPEEVAGIVAVLASGFGSYVTGSTVFVDGGMTDYADFAHGG